MSAVDPGTSSQEATPASLAALGKSWWVLLAFGVISILLGIWFLVSPEKAFTVLAVVFAIWLLVSGIFALARSFAHGLSAGTRVLFIITGVLSIILGLFALRGGSSDSWANADFILAIFIGVAFLFRGFGQLFAGIDQPEGRGWNIFAGIVILIGGVIILSNLWTAAVLIWVAGIWLLIIGIFEIISAFMVKSAAKKLAA